MIDVTHNIYVKHTGAQCKLYRYQFISERDIKLNHKKKHARDTGKINIKSEREITHPTDSGFFSFFFFVCFH